MAATRPYQLAEIQGLKNSELAELVISEIDKWPHKPRTPNGVHRAKKDDLIAALLSGSNGFTTTKPPPIALPESHETSFHAGGGATPNAAFAPFTAQLPLALPNPLPLPNFRLSDSLPPHEAPVNPHLISLPPVPERRNLQVFVMDQRRLEDTLYQPQTAEISVEVHTDSQTPDTLRFHARDLVQALQATNARLDGDDPVSIGHQHSAEMRGFFVTFAKEVVPDNCMSYRFTPETLRFPRDGNLLVSVNVPQRTVLKTDTQSMPASVTHESSPSPAESSKEATQKGMKRDPAVVQYLKEMLLERENLGERVRKNKGIILHNPDIVDEWRRVMDFYVEFVGKRSPRPSGKKITKADLVAALECSQSWLDAAKEGYEKVKLYGEGGSQPSSEVIRRLEDRPVTGPEGKGKLLEFLKGYQPAP
ncbi:hypothetical protein PM082_015713 [Marasmius tenuissimus]|nr:hypothetical protein PM082_015713 [Marasmius tenuissimus]